ncbi:MAG: ribosome maturation factor RimM [Clostridium sp.]|nr:ribosome maturation factor RimM [Clostridium sp.]MCM1444691.1 ribosome maturation factor RimM [Candidatus Amulumruptor caecigallinarius]
MKYIYVGKIVNTHALKGELRIISDFKYKENVFKKDFKLYIGSKKKEMIISTYRKHKMYDMILFSGIDNIDQALEYKNELVYINKDDLKIDGYFNEDLIGLHAYILDKYIGIVEEILVSKAHDILVIIGEKKHLVPNISEFIKKVDLKNKKIYIEKIEGI